MKTLSKPERQPASSNSRDKRYKRIFLLDEDPVELLGNKRTLETMDLADRVFTFRTINAALLCLMRPGAVPEFIIVGEQMEDGDIGDFMVRFSGLPYWVTEQCKVCLLIPELCMEENNEEFFHPLIYKVIRKPFCVFELNNEDELLNELSNQ
jgi:hypothetical protein